MRRLLLFKGIHKYEKINEAQSLANALRLMMKGYDGRKTRGLKITTHTATG